MSALLRLILAFLPLAQQASSFASAPMRSDCCTRAAPRVVGRNGFRGSPLTAAPEGALSDIVIPNVFTGGIFANDNIDADEEEDPRIWVPQTDCLSFRPLCFCVSQGYYVNLLKFKGGGVLGCHRHPSPVHALTLKGSWGYKEHDWNAKPGTYVFEPPGETHSLIVDEDCDEMVAMFHGTYRTCFSLKLKLIFFVNIVTCTALTSANSSLSNNAVTGALIYVDPGSGEVTGYDDVFTKLEKARDWYEECGLGRDYAEQFIR